MQVGTGHALVAGHIGKWVLDPTCKLCLEDEETVSHLFLSYPALEWARRELETLNKEPIWDRLAKFFSMTSLRNLFGDRSEDCSIAT